MTQTSRVLRLLGLLQSRPTWTGPELADRLGVTTRTVRRDVDRLRTLGYPVRAAQGVGGGYQLGSGTALPPLLLDDEEAVAVAVSLRLAAGGTVAGVGEAAMRTLGKLDQVLPARLRASVEAVSEATVTLERRDQLVEGSVVALLARAARGCREVRFGYAAASGEETRRRAEPYRLVIGLGGADLAAGVSLARSRLNLANILDVAESRRISCLVVGPPPGLGDPEQQAELSAAFADAAGRRRVPYVETYGPLVHHDQWLADLAAGDGRTPGQAGYGLLAWLVLHTGWSRWLDLPDDVV